MIAACCASALRWVVVQFDQIRTLPSFAIRPLVLVRLPVSLSRIHCVNQVSERKQRDSQDCGEQIEIMANAVLRSPAHARKNTKSFKHMSENHDDQARCTKALHKGGNALSS